MAFKILAVEDEPAVQRAIWRTLRSDYEVETASNGAQALERLETGGYDLLLLDLVMPQMSGIEVLRRLKETGRRPRRLIVLTASREAAKRLSEKEFQVDRVLYKPFQVDDLLEAVAAVA